MVSAMALALGSLDEASEHAKLASEIAQSTEKPRLGEYALVLAAEARLVGGDFGGAVGTVNASPAFELGHVGPNWKSLLAYGMAAAAATESSVDEQRFRDRLAESEPSPAELAGADLLAAIYGWRESESAYQAARSAGAPSGIFDRTIWAPAICLAAARWGIEDETLNERTAALVDRTGYARGRALLTHAQGLRALRLGEHGKAEKLIFDATQAFATLDLEYDRMVAVADHARALGALHRSDEAAAERADVRAYAERAGAKALAGTLEPTPAAV
jgi:hypothetical protein